MSLKSIKFLIPVALIILCISCQEDKSQDVPEPVFETISAEKFVLPAIPDSIEFCGQIVYFDDFDMRERLDKELIVNTFYHSSTIQGLKRANRYFGDIGIALTEAGIPEDFKYLCLIESGLTQAVSPAGARGFWQFMPATAKEYDLKINKEVDERLNIQKSTLAACTYLNNANERFNDWVLTAASYNMGMGGVANAMESQEVDSYFDLYLSSETSRYVFRILALKIIHENQEAYGFNSEELELYEPIQTRSIEVNETIENLKHWAVENGSNYRKLRILNPWIIGNKLTCKEGEVLTIELPE
ncbi:MAG: lytic transglycosylase domain-containing protein [Crocinitomicaceae bacterium]|nr:lytic transglycosylase domain-containing protein [Crocinitomicaceae bacterium]